MSGTTTQLPMTVENLIKKLKLLPMTMMIQVSNIQGTFYIMDLEVIDACNVNFVLAKLPLTEE